MQRSRLKNIINKSKTLSNKQEIGNPFDEFKKSLPIEVDDNYRLEAAWKAYGKPKDYKAALWEGLIQPIDETNVKLPSIGYNEETDEYEYLNKGEDNEIVAKDIRVWDNNVIPLVQELKLGGYVRTFNKEKNCWTYTKNSQKENTLDQNQVNIQKEPSGDLIEEFKSGGKKKIKIKTIWDDYIEVDSISDDQRAGRTPIGKRNGQDLYLNGDGIAAPLNHAPGKQENGGIIDSFQKGGKPEKEEKVNDNISLEEFINQKIQERTEAAIKKATTRKTGYKFKNKSWKNCIATATDNYGVPIVLRNSDLAADPKKYGFEELQFGDNTDTLPDGVLIQDYNKPNDYTTPGHTIMLVGRTETGAPIYSYSSGSSDPSDMHNSTTKYFFDKWNDKVKPRAYRYIGTPAERAAWEEEYRAMYPEVESFKQGGQMNVIPEGALHARKNNMDLAKEGEVTHKGIPVVDNEGNQTAEVEKEEWTMTKELTEAVEEWCKKYYDEETSQKEKDELAIKCGKRICKELLHNTDDRAGLIERMEEEL